MHNSCQLARRGKLRFSVDRGRALWYDCLLPHIPDRSHAEALEDAARGGDESDADTDARR